MARARKGGNIQKTLSFLTFGEKGTWKSTIGAEAAALKRADGKNMRVLIFDAEFGGMDSAVERVLETHPEINSDDIYIVYTESYTEVMAYLDKIINNKPFYELDDEGKETDDIVLDSEGKQFNPDFIVVDGTTVIYNASSIAKLKFSEKRAKVKADKDQLTGLARTVKIEGADLEVKDYKSLNMQMSQEFILKLLATGKHHYITAREVDEKKSVRGDDGKFQSIPTGKKIPQGFKDMEYNVGTVIRLYIDEEFSDVRGQIVNKDRTNTFMQNELIDSPTLLAWQEVINKNVGKEKVKVSPTFSESIEKELEGELGKSGLLNSEDLKTPEQFHAKIAEILSSLSQQDKKKKGEEIKAEKLPMTFKKVFDIDILKKYVEVLES